MSRLSLLLLFWGYSSHVIASPTSVIDGADRQYVATVFAELAKRRSVEGEGTPSPLVKRLLCFSNMGTEQLFADTISPTDLRITWMNSDKSSDFAADLLLLVYQADTHLESKLSTLTEPDELLFYRDLGVPTLDEQIDWQIVNSSPNKEHYLELIERADRVRAEYDLWNSVRNQRNSYRQEASRFVNSLRANGHYNKDLLAGRIKIYEVQAQPVMDWVEEISE